jgi:hypothetical protein
MKTEAGQAGDRHDQHDDKDIFHNRVFTPLRFTLDVWTVTAPKRSADLSGRQSGIGSAQRRNISPIRGIQPRARVRRRTICHHTNIGTSQITFSHAAYRAAICP